MSNGGYLPLEPLRGQYEDTDELRGLTVQDVLSSALSVGAGAGAGQLAGGLDATAVAPVAFAATLAASAWLALAFGAPPRDEALAVVVLRLALAAQALVWLRA